jgi:hypothetical protein
VLAPLAVFVLLAAPEQAHFWMELDGLPSGEVTLSREGGGYRYRSVHLFGRGGKRTAREEQLALDAQGKDGAGRVPEGLWLWRRPPLGCVDGREELTGRLGPLCAEHHQGANTRGTLLGQPFEAAYDAQGELHTLSLAGVRFVRRGAQPLRAPPAAEPQRLVLPDGPGAPCLVPAPRLDATPLRPWRLSTARALAEALAAQAPAESCLERARAFRARALSLGGDARVVHGLWVTKGRALPHAWVQVRAEDGRLVALDPANAPPAAPGSLIPLAVETGPGRGGAVAAGEARRALWRGQTRLERCR